MSDNTRYQIMGRGKDDKRPIENFTADQLFAFKRRQKELKSQGVDFTVWDTRQNALSRLLSF